MHPRHFVLTAAASLLCTVYSPRSHANVPTLVRDINTVPIGVSSNPSFVGTLGGATFFAATDGIHGVELWKTNGTGAGTLMVQDIEPGAGSSNPTNFAVFGSRAYFVATTQVSGTKMWVTDGTSSGTYKLTDLILEAGFATPSAVGALGSTVLIGGGDASGLHLWGTDGTAAGTVLLADTSFTPTLHPNGFTVASNGKAYFAGFDNVNGAQPWVTDGTPAGTHLLAGQPPGLNSFSPTSFVQAGNYVYFVQSTNQVQNLFRIRLADDGIEQVTTGIGIEDYSSPPSLPLVPLGNLVLFVGTSAGVEQVWRSDGTAGGTYAICPFNSALGNSYVAPRFTVAGAHAFFVTVINAGASASYFASDGTVAGTVDIFDAGGFPPRVVGAAGSFYYFAPSQSGIYRSDGTVAGTKLIAGPALSIIPGTWLNFAGDSTAAYFGFVLTNATSGAADYVTGRYDSTADAMTILNHDASQPGDLFALSSGLLYFSINSPTLGIEPGVSDGTTAGTHLLADIAAEPSEAGSNPTGFVNFNGQLYFSASDGIAGQELWRSDGTAAGTQLAADVLAGPLGSNPFDLFVAAQSLMFFAYYGPSSGTSLWRYDPVTGTATTNPVVGPPYSCSTYATPTVQGLTYFTAYGNGVELWKTDGTPAGTASVPIPQGILSNPCSIVGYGGKAYVITQQFGANGAGYYLWGSDGTTAGTQALAFLGTQPFATPFFVIPYAGQLYFAGVDNTGMPTLWRSDGTATGTHSVATLPGSLGSLIGVVNNRLLFTGVSGSMPWSFDAASASFTAIPSVLYYQPGPIAEGGALAFFTGLDASHGLGPWVTDGTPAGTKALADAQGNYPGSVQWLGDFRGVAIYTAVNSSNAAGYWRSDGTVAGTHMIAPLATGQSVSVTNPTGLVVGNRFYFAVTDPVIGTELYSLLSDVPATTTTTLKAIPTSAIVGKSIVLTASVTPATGGSVPTGLVTFSDDAIKFGSVTLNAAGVAVLATATLAVGTHAITAAYAGDSGDAASTSAATTVTVTAKAPTVTIGISPSSIPEGGSATLIWSSTDAGGCTASGAWTGAETMQGSLVVMPAAAGTLTYTLACTGGGGVATGTATLTVTAAPKSGGGGGGAFDLIGLAALGVILIVRFRRRGCRAR